LEATKELEIEVLMTMINATLTEETSLQPGSMTRPTIRSGSETTTTKATTAHPRSSRMPSVRSLLVVAVVVAASALLSLEPAQAFTSVATPTTSRGSWHHQQQQRNYVPHPSVVGDGAAASQTALNVHPPSKFPVVDADVVSKASPSPSPREVSAATRNLNPTPVLVAAWQDLIANQPTDAAAAASKNAAAAAALSAVALATVLMLSPLNADAAMSGGRMGGSFPSSRQSYSRPAPSYRGSYGGGYSTGYGSRGYYNRMPGITVVPPPIIAPISPFGGYGYGLGNPFSFGAPGIVSYGRGPGLFDLFLWGGIGLFLLNAFRGAASAVDGAASSFTSGLDDRFAAEASALGPGTSVVQLTVALDVPKRDDPSSILSVLNRLAATARTDSRVGIQNLASQVALELLRRKSSIVSAAASSQHYKNRDQALRNYNSVSIKERAKFEQETVSQYGGVDYGDASARLRSYTSGSLVDGQATMAVVTLLLAIDGDSTKLPSISSIASVEEALRKIAGDVKVDTCLQSAEILWTPTDRSETLTLREVVADYPQLRSV
jgi:uncharacterized membrane protein